MAPIKSAEKKAEATGFPKFQNSYFCESGEQIVVRDNDIKEFEENVKAAKALFPLRAPRTPKLDAFGDPISQPTPNKTFVKRAPEYTGGVCPKDGGKLKIIRGTSKKTGKPYEMIVCDNGKFINGVKSGCDYSTFEKTR